ncbi:10427_t:CDS:1, partial [Paraglomus brasilianum]
MSFPSVPSVEEVSKWSPKDVITFLETKKEELFLDDDDINVIKRNKVAGCAFLDLSQEEFERCGLTVGPAKTIMRLIKAIKSQPE